jgi:hypothetical protein
MKENEVYEEKWMDFSSKNLLTIFCQLLLLKVKTDVGYRFELLIE